MIREYKVSAELMCECVWVCVAHCVRIINAHTKQTFAP